MTLYIRQIKIIINFNFFHSYTLLSILACLRTKEMVAELVPDELPIITELNLDFSEVLIIYKNNLN